MTKVAVRVGAGDPARAILLDEVAWAHRGVSPDGWRPGGQPRDWLFLDDRDAMRFVRYLALEFPDVHPFVCDALDP